MTSSPKCNRYALSFQQRLGSTYRLVTVIWWERFTFLQQQNGQRRPEKKGVKCSSSFSKNQIYAIICRWKSSAWEQCLRLSFFIHERQKKFFLSVRRFFFCWNTTIFLRWWTWQTSSFRSCQWFVNEFQKPGNHSHFLLSMIQSDIQWNRYSSLVVKLCNLETRVWFWIRK